MADNFKSYKKEVLKKLTDTERQALETIGFFVEAEAKLRTPVLTGTLRRSITNKVNENEKSVAIGTNVEYAEYVEKGTSKMKSQPYLEPSVMDNIDEIQNIIKNIFKNMK
ncbi:MAG: hypothetical protein PWQ70_2187 [Clostridiales bacterium]|nr:hypothetical protein [Clostridiales bacterium]